MDANTVVAHYAAKLMYTEAELQKAAQRIKQLEKEVADVKEKQAPTDEAIFP